MSDQGLRIPALRFLSRVGWLHSSHRYPIGLGIGIIALACFAVLGLAPAIIDLPAPDKMDLLHRLSAPLPHIRLAPTIWGVICWRD